MIELVNFTYLDIWNNINFRFPTNKVIFISGENGIGKTVLLDCICKIDSGYTGQILCDGSISYLPANIHVYGRLRVEDIMTYVFEMFNSMIIHSSDELLSYFGDYKIIVGKLLKKEIRDLSNGQKKLLFFLTYSFLESQYYIFDEPFSGMDEHNKKLCLRRLREFSNNKTIIITNHEELKDFDEYKVLDSVSINLKNWKFPKEK